MTSNLQDWGDALNTALLEESADDLYEHAPCGYLSVLADGTIAKVNATFSEWTGFAKDALIGRTRLVDLFTVGGRVYYETHFQPLLRMQGSVREIAFELKRASGERLPVLINATEHHYPAAGVITRITVFDATQRRRYERELLEARQRAEDASRAKTDLVAMISHDVRGPLSAITMAIALLEKSSPTSEQERFIKVLQSSTAHALAVVNNVLDLSRLESGRTVLREHDFAVRELAEEFIAAARGAAVTKPELDVRLRIDETVPERLLGDRAKIGQIIANLIMNAVKFTHRGFVLLAISTREITTEAVTLDVVVSDSGIGIPTDRLAAIFEEYTQASDDIAEKYGGTGLGLAISRKLLRLYGSDLSVSSTVGQGTTFSFPLTLKRLD